MAQKVLIRHKDGREYAVSAADFRRVKHRDGQTYEEQGFRIVSNEDGSPYEAPKAAAKKDGD